MKNDIIELRDEFISAELDRWTNSPDIYPRWKDGNNWSHKLVVLFAAHIAKIATGKSGGKRND